MRKASIIAIVALAALTPAVRSEEAATKLTPDKLPAKVAESIKARFPKAEITSAEKETEDGNVVYDLELKLDGLKYESDIKEDGTILEIEKQIKDVPAAVAKAVEAKYPKAKIGEVMEVNKVNGKEEKPEKYEVTISSDGKEKEVIVALDGSSVKEEAPEPAAK